MEFLDAIFLFIQTHPFIALTIVAALGFDFVNGFHDSANAIATVVATRVLTPLQAVLLAGTFNFIGPFVFSLAVASTVGKGIINPEAYFDLTGVIFAALLGAIVWDLITWYTGLPTSSSHALVGGLIGAGLAAQLLGAVDPAAGKSALVVPELHEWLGVLEAGAIGAAVALGIGVLMLGYSRIKLPRVLFKPMAGLGAVLAAAFYFWTTGGPPTEEDAHLIEYWFSMGTTSLMGSAFLAVAWVATQQRMGAELIPYWAPIGAAVGIAVAVLEGWLHLGGITKTVVFMIVSPFLGFFAGFLLATIVSWWGHGGDRHEISAWSRRLQLCSSAFYALNHGTNDAQKTMGVIGVLLVAAGTITVEPGARTLEVPTWVIIASAAAMGCGTLFGGWKIVKTMASRITHLNPAQGFAAETGGGVVLAAMAHAGIPVSTTHAISSSIMGVGATRRLSAVRWGVGRRIVGAWILTIPASAAVSWLTYVVYHFLGGV